MTTNNNSAVKAGAAVTAPMSTTIGVNTMKATNESTMNTINLSLHHATVKSQFTAEQILNATLVAQKEGKSVPNWAKRLVTRVLAAKRTVHLNEAPEEKGVDVELVIAARKAIDARHDNVRISDRAIYNVAKQTDAEYQANEVEVAKAIDLVSPQSLTERLLSPMTGTPIELYRPLLLGSDVRSWVRSLAHRRLENKVGTEYSALYGATVMANSAISAVNRRLYGAYLVDIIDHEQFEDMATKTQDIVATAAISIAAHGNRDSATHGSALMEVRVRVKEHGVEGHEGRLGDVQQMITDLAKDAKASDAALAVELIEEFQQLLTLRDMASSKSLHNEDTSDSKPNDTGWTAAAILSFNHLYSIPTNDLAGIEAEMARALWTGKGLRIPALHKELMEERLSVAYATSLEYNPRDAYKVEKRVAFFDSNIEGKVSAVNKAGEAYTQNLAGYARWAINSFTRRLWRDVQMLTLAKEQYTTRLDTVLERIKMEEDDDTIKPSLTRFNAGETQELGYTIRLPFLPEIGDEDLDPQATQGERLTALYNLVLGEIQTALPKVKELYTEYRALDEAHSTIWALMESESLPVSAPPIYWNDKGWYMTEEEAQNALMDEIAERITSAKDASADAIADTLEAALASIGTLV